MMKKGSKVYRWVQFFVTKVFVITENLLSEVCDSLRNSMLMFESMFSFSVICPAFMAH